MYRYALVLLLICSAVLTACASVPAAQTTPTVQAIPPVTDLPATAPTDPLMGTMEQPTIPPLADYRSPSFGYTFSYPVTSALEEMGGGRIVWVDKQISIVVSDTDPETQVGGEVIQSADSTIVNGVTARRLSGMVGAVGGSTPQLYERIVINRGARYYAITVYELRNDVLLPDYTPSSIPLPAQELFNTVLATFTLTG